MVDASHGNSQKNHLRQPDVVHDLAGQIAGGEAAIRGVMLESNLVAGRQDLDQRHPDALEYGKSVTDACVDLDMTVAMLDELAAAARARRARRGPARRPLTLRQDRGRGRRTESRGVSAPAERPGLRWDLMLLLGVLSAFGPLSMDLYLPALPQVADEFAAGQAPVQLTISAAAIGLAAGQLLAGPLSDRRGRRRPVLVGVSAWTLASLLCALAPNVWTLVAIRLLQGIGGAAGIVLARAIVRDRLEGVAAAKAFAVLASISAAAPVLAPVLGGQLLRLTDGAGCSVR